MRSNDSYLKSNQRDSHNATATKSPDRRVNYTHSYTPTRFSRKPSDRVNQIKSSLNQCIDNLSNKRQANRQAIQQVKQVNKQLLDTLSTTNPPSQRGYLSSRQPLQNYRIPQYNYDYSNQLMNDPRQQKQRDIVTSFSSFHLAPADNIYRQSQSNFHMSQVYRPESVMSTHTMTEIEDLRGRIRSQRMENQQLQRQLEILRKELSSSVSSSYGVNTNTGQASYLMAENNRLRAELYRLETHQNIQSIYEEFIKLKQDNQRLRKQTINMLKNGKY